MFTVKNTGSNYLARIIKLGPPRKHSNADKLLVHTVLFNNIITDLSYKENDLVVYFPLECQINKDFISYINGFQKKELNKDKEVRGFFDNNSRVRAVKLRGEPSAGFIIKLEILIKWLESKKIKIDADDVFYTIDVDFDTFNDILICQKYIVPVKNSGHNLAKQKVARESRIVEGQFHFHVDTKHLKKELNVLKPDDLITIGYKLHGTSAVFSNILVKKKLSLAARILKKLGLEIIDTKHDYVYSSRKVIKNDFTDKKHDSYYDHDVWETINERIKDKIRPGYSIYGEICGQLPSGKYIQNLYDYGCRENTCEFFVYRITFTDSLNHVIELTTPQIQRYCEKYQLNTVPIFYYGRAKNKYPELDIENHWHENFLNELIKEYTEKKCYMCKNDVFAEG
ncbi:RNA ligase family protein, partial [Flavobacterium sp.]|uniref:RNA ligase family protein n=1 Tax=Flavobacterium sp. TaxID=239 RepID=UPI0038FC2670